MRVYETTFIVNPQTDDSTLENQVTAVSDLINQNGGTVLHEDRLGTRRLAYPINKLTQGYYTSFIYEAPSDVLPVLDRHFRLGEEYLRFLTLLYEGDMKQFRKEEEPEASETPAAKPEEAEAAPEKAEDAEVSADEPTAEETVEPEAKVETETTEESQEDKEL